MPEPVSRQFSPAWRWAALLGLALLAPAALPAGGADRRLPEVRRRGSGPEPFLVEEGIALRCAPDSGAPVLTRLEPQEPLRVLRRWLAPDGRRWLRVAASTPLGRPARGWLPG
jgi:hypothetical protein